MRLLVLYGVVFILSVLTISEVYGRPEQDVRRCYQTNEVYTECGSACPATCTSILSKKPVACIALCVPGCFCAAGHVRNRWGNCIPENKCPCNRPNETYTCGSACRTSCDTLNQECSLKNKKCNTACFCQDGFARDKNDLCIPIHECPGYKTS